MDVQKRMKPAVMRPLTPQGRLSTRAGFRPMGVPIKRPESVSLSVWVYGWVWATQGGSWRVHCRLPSRTLSTGIPISSTWRTRKESVRCDWSGDSRLVTSPVNSRHELHHLKINKLAQDNEKAGCSTQSQAQEEWIWLHTKPRRGGAPYSPGRAWCLLDGACFLHHFCRCEGSKLLISPPRLVFPSTST